MWREALCDQRLSFSAVFSGPTHIVACSSLSCIVSLVPTHSSFDGLSLFLHLLVLTKNAAINICVDVSEWTLVSSSLRYMPGSGDDGAWRSLCVEARDLPDGAAKSLHHYMFSAAVSEGSELCVFTALAVTWLFDASRPSGGEVLSHCGFGFQFFDDWRCQVSSCLWPFMHRWRNVCSSPLPIFQLGCLSAELLRVDILGTSLARDVTCWHFLLFCGWSFHLLDGILWSTEVFNFGEVQLTCFFFHCSCFCCRI